MDGVPGLLCLWIDRDSFSSYIDNFVGYPDSRSDLYFIDNFLGAFDSRYHIDHLHTYIENPVQGTTSIIRILM